jgi:hypothetical protein
VQPTPVTHYYAHPAQPQLQPQAVQPVQSVQPPLPPRAQPPLPNAAPAGPPLAGVRSRERLVQRPLGRSISRPCPLRPPRRTPPPDQASNPWWKML